MLGKLFGIVLCTLLILVVGRVANAQILETNDYIGGDAQSGPGQSGQVSGGGGWWPDGFTTDSGDGPNGYGTRSPLRTVNGHQMSTGGDRGLLSKISDSGWLGQMDANADNPASADGSTWIYWEFDAPYALGDMRVWNWNNPSSWNASTGEANGVKDVLIHTCVSGCGIGVTDPANWSQFGETHTAAQAPGTPGYTGDVLLNFGGIDAKAVSLTVLNSYDVELGSGPDEVSTVHGIGEVSFDIVGGTSTPDRTWRNDAGGNWLSGSNWDPGMAPTDNTLNAILGGAISAPRTITVDDPVTVKSLTINSSVTYNVSGTNVLTLDADDDMPAIIVTSQGGATKHEIKVDLALADSATITAGDNTVLDINDSIALGSNNLNIEQAAGGFSNGIVNVNNEVTGTGTLTSTATLGTGNATAIGGDLVSSGTLDIDITANSTDMFIVGGDATLSGTLDIDLADGMSTPSSVTVLRANSITNGGLSLGGPDGGLFTIDTAALANGQLTLVSGAGPGPGVAGDYNGDGTVNAADYTVWRDGASQSVSPGTGADGSGNGLVGPEDYEIWKTNFGTSGGGAGSAAVPEPTVGIMIVLGVLGLVGVRRRLPA